MDTSIVILNQLNREGNIARNVNREIRRKNVNFKSLIFHKTQFADLYLYKKTF